MARGRLREPVERIEQASRSPRQGSLPARDKTPPGGLVAEGDRARPRRGSPLRKNRMRKPLRREKPLRKRAATTHPTPRNRSPRPEAGRDNPVEVALKVDHLRVARGRTTDTRWVPEGGSSILEGRKPWNPLVPDHFCDGHLRLARKARRSLAPAVSPGLSLNTLGTLRRPFLPTLPSTEESAKSCRSASSQANNTVAPVAPAKASTWASFDRRMGREGIVCNAVSTFSCPMSSASPRWL